MIKWLYVGIIVILGLISCDSPLRTSRGKEIPDSDSVLVDTDLNDTLSTAICLWEKVGLREQPGRNKNIKYITTILLGEKVYMLGESQKVDSENRTYIKVRLSDGQEGWVYKYLFGIDAKIGAVGKATSIYRRPDPMMLKTDKFEAGEFVAVVDEMEEWVMVQGWQKKKVGWIKKEGNLTEDLEDVKVVVLYQRAVHEQEIERKVDMLKTILENTRIDSRFLNMVKTDLNQTSQLMKQSNLHDNQLRITVQKAELRSRPDTSDKNILAELYKGTVCDVISIWPPESLGSEMDNTKWFEVQHDGKQGWVFGALTSVVTNP